MANYYANHKRGMPQNPVPLRDQGDESASERPSKINKIALEQVLSSFAAPAAAPLVAHAGGLAVDSAAEPSFEDRIRDLKSRPQSTSLLRLKESMASRPTAMAARARGALAAKQPAVERVVVASSPSSSTSSDDDDDDEDNPVDNPVKPLTGEQRRVLESHLEQLTAMVDDFTTIPFDGHRVRRRMPTTMELAADDAFRESYLLIQDIYTHSGITYGQVAAFVEVPTTEAVKRSLGIHAGRGGSKKGRTHEQGRLMTERNHRLARATMKPLMDADTTLSVYDASKKAMEMVPALAGYKISQLRYAYLIPYKGRRVSDPQMRAYIAYLYEKFRNNPQKIAIGDAINNWQSIDLGVAGTAAPISLSHLNSSQITEIASRERRAGNAPVEPAVKSQVDWLLQRYPPGYAAEKAREAEEEEAAALRWDANEERQLQALKPALFLDPRQFLPFAGSARGFLHDASCPGFAAWASIAFNSHGHTDHGMKMATVAMAEAMHSKGVVFLCQEHHAKLLRTVVGSSAGMGLAPSMQTMADVLGMGRLPLDLVRGVAYHTEFELPGAPGVKIELLPALHCPGDCVTMLLDASSDSPPSAHIFTGDFCAEPALIEDVKRVMARWKAVHPLLLPGRVSMDATGCWNRYGSPREVETERIKSIVRNLRFDLDEEKALLVVLNGVPLGHRLDLAVALAEQMDTNVYLEPRHWQMFTALRDSQYPDYIKPEYSRVVGDQEDALVHLLEWSSLRTIADIRATMDRVADGSHRRPAAVARTVCFQTMGFHRTRWNVMHPSRVVHCEPTTFTDHSVKTQLVAFAATLRDLGFERDNVSLLQKYGSGHDDAMKQIWPV